MKDGIHTRAEANFVVLTLNNLGEWRHMESSGNRSNCKCGSFISIFIYLECAYGVMLRKNEWFL